MVFRKRLLFRIIVAIFIVLCFVALTRFQLTNELPVCPKLSPYLVGWTNVSSGSESPSPSEWEYFEMKYKGVVQPGGRYGPLDCTARYKVAIIVPYRDRMDHLRRFLIHMHPFLQRQYQVDYTIFVIEQFGTHPFNRGKLLNVGAVEALKMDPKFDCFIFHDVDLIPEDDRNLYTCPEGHPVHMSVAVSRFNYQPLYLDLFGGVTAMTRGQFNLVNGYSNEFWGWGSEDDDMFNRVLRAGLAPIQRPPTRLAHYTMLGHGRNVSQINPIRGKLLRKGLEGGHTTDGLNSLRYKRLELKLETFHVHVVADLGEP